MQKISRIKILWRVLGLHTSLRQIKNRQQKNLHFANCKLKLITSFKKIIMRNTSRLTILLGILFFMIGCHNNKSTTPSNTEKTTEANTEKTNEMNHSSTTATINTPATTSNQDIVINGITLDEKMINDFKKRYHQKPFSGKYWYDSFSGLWGLEGMQAAGFIFPGHSYGNLSPNASNGNSGIFINTRQISWNEAMVWSQITGVPPQQGRYWLDGKGNVGYEGYPYIAFNLYMAASQHNYHGAGKGGDHFWSSRFASGNSNDDNSGGYVAIPGGDAVFYGNW
jgi:hypothetical protein